MDGMNIYCLDQYILFIGIRTLCDIGWDELSARQMLPDIRVDSSIRTSVSVW
jgi:hypothetical protein